MAAGTAAGTALEDREASVTACSAGGGISAVYTEYSVKSPQEYGTTAQ